MLTFRRRPSDRDLLESVDDLIRRFDSITP